MSKTAKRPPAKLRAEEAVAPLTDAQLARELAVFADEIERDTGRAYAPEYMREAARRLMNR